jgi:AsmA family protein
MKMPRCFPYTGSRPVVALKWVATITVALIALLCVVLTFIDWNAMRGPIGRFASAHTGRTVSIDGPLEVHLFSFTPRVMADKVSIGNPSWESHDAPPLATLEHVAIAVKLLPLLKFDVILPEVTVEHPEIYLHRNASGQANWSSGSASEQKNRASEPLHLPTVQRFFVRDGALQVKDEIRKLRFAGSLQAGEQAAKPTSHAFDLTGRGELNAKPFSLQVYGGPLINADPDKPYEFDSKIRAADIRLDAKGRVRKPFDLATLEADMHMSGKDLADLYYLTGLALPNTPPYDLTTAIALGERKVHIEKIKGNLGASDVRGELTVDISHPRPLMTGALESDVLNIADLSASLGTQVPKNKGTATMANDRSPSQAAQSSEAKSADTQSADVPAAHASLLFPDAHLQVNRVRAMDADVHYAAKDINAGKVPMHEVSLRVVLNDGVLQVDPVTFTLPQGKLTGNVRIDASKDVPRTQADLRMTDVHLDQFRSPGAQGPSPFEGTLQARARLLGEGDSVHAFASTADGTVTAVVPHGEVRAAFAELTGINVTTALGLMLVQDDKQAKLRCGIADFKVEDGDMHAQNVVFDTQNVLITGSGDVRLGSEHLDLALKGQPKKLKFVRLRTPILIGGQLRKPTVGVKASRVAGQAGAAVALGALISPLAAVVAFVDPGLAKDANCAALFAEAQEKGTPRTRQNAAAESQALTQTHKTRVDSKTPG